MGEINDNITIDYSNMNFTDQRTFLKALALVIFTEEEIEADDSNREFNITKKDIKKAILSSLLMNKQTDRMEQDLTIDNILLIAKSHISNIKKLISTGEMTKNIQTLDTEKGTPEYQEFKLSTLEKRIFNTLKRMNLNDKKKYLSVSLSNKEITNNYLDAYDSYGIRNYFSIKATDLFPYKTISTTNHFSDNELINDEDLLKNKPSYTVNAEVTKENILKYAKELKAFNDMMKKKPWYIRWFSSDYSSKMNALEASRVILYNRGVSKKSLKKFMNSNGDEKALKDFFKSNEASINKINKENKEKMDMLASKQDNINNKNFFKEQELSKQAQKTLDKANVYVEDKDLDDGFKKAREEIKKDKEFFEECLTNPLFTKELKDFTIKEIIEANKNLEFVDKLEKELKDKKPTQIEKEDLVFDPKKDILESSDNLDIDLSDEIDDNFEKEALDSFTQAEEEINQKKM